ncbi:hypothetical protein C8R44DRAFT_725638 [Mycena epipterygia]|nr:hypothetical protein C8R44DRAFT_725638 [Mycena epipterygia]
MSKSLSLRAGGIPNPEQLVIACHHGSGHRGTRIVHRENEKYSHDDELALTTAWPGNVTWYFKHLFFDPQLEPNSNPNLTSTWVTNHHIFVPGRMNEAKSDRRSWGMKLGSKLDVRLWSRARFDIQLGTPDYLVPQLQAELGSSWGQSWAPIEMF